MHRQGVSAPAQSYKCLNLKSLHILMPPTHTYIHIHTYTPKLGAKIEGIPEGLWSVWILFPRKNMLVIVYMHVCHLFKV